MAPDRRLIVDQLRAAGCVFAEDEADLLIESCRNPGWPHEAEREFEEWRLERRVARRVTGEPLEYVLGWAEFAGRRYEIRRGVFVPRHRTEFLVRLAADAAPPMAVVVDLCCGCGALGDAVARSVAVAELHATDIDPIAFICARVNLPDAQVGHGDLYEPLSTSLRGHVDVLLVNVPYVPSGEIKRLTRESRKWEPMQALDGGPDGLAVYRRVVQEAPDWLAPGGRLYVELNETQLASATAFAEAKGMHVQVEHDDETTVLVAISSLAP